MLTIGSQAIYTGDRHPSLINRKVQIVAVHKKYFVDPDQCRIIYDPAKVGEINPETDMIEVKAVGAGNRLILGASDCYLTELKPLDVDIAASLANVAGSLILALTLLLLALSFPETAKPVYAQRLTVTPDWDAAISPTVIAEIIGGGTDYNKAVNGIPMAVNYNGNLAAAYPASDTTEIVVEASHCDQNTLPPPGFNVTRAFIEYDTSAITRPLASARLVFTNYEPFVHDGTGQAVHDLLIHRGTWAATAELTPTFVASTTFQAWQTSGEVSVSILKGMVRWLVTMRAALLSLNIHRRKACKWKSKYS